VAGNANSGRIPQPTAIKKQNGITRKDRLNTNEPIPPAGIIVRPAYLNDAAALVWDRLAPLADAMGTLSTADVEALSVLCALLADFHVTRNGKVAGIIKGYLADFGFTPASRSRLVSSVTNKPENELEEFFD
jgi:phage terminase small subunit